MSDIEMKPCPYCGGRAETHCENGAFYVGCIDCFMRGPEILEVRADAENDAIAVWNALPRRLQWTTEPPTKPDFYWHRDDGGVLGIAYIYGAEGALFCHFAGEEGIAPLLDLVTGEWAGPIPEPEEQP